MSFVSRPTNALPEPLRAAELATFTHHSVVVRLPEIARRVLAENHYSPSITAAIQALIDEIPTGRVRPLRLPLAGAFPRDTETGCGSAGAAQWAAWTVPYEGMNWLEIPWFFAEEYFYARILEASGYFFEGPQQGKDPYAQQKRMGLESTRDSLTTLAAQLAYALYRPAGENRDSLARLVLADLWGNQNDLSMWPVKKLSGQNGHSGGAAGADLLSTQSSAGGREQVLADQLDEALDYLATLKPEHTRVDILLDNAGYELVTDLALADFLISSGSAAQVTLHAKCHPVFVSDALEKDVHETIDFLSFMEAPPVKAFALRLRSALVDRRLRLSHHPFWTSPLAAWEMPADLQQTMTGCSLLIVKGDANYRRLLGDRHWPHDLPFAQVVDYFACAVLALRTLKSEITTGVSPERAPAGDPRWMINGRWGLVQFAAPARHLSKNRV